MAIRVLVCHVSAAALLLSGSRGREREIEGEAEAEARGRRTSRCCGAWALVDYVAPSLSRREGPLALRTSLADFLVLLRLVPDLTAHLPSVVRRLLARRHQKGWL